MSRMPARSRGATLAFALVQRLQRRYARGLEALEGDDRPRAFRYVEWSRDEGRHGGGNRLVASPGGVFNRASINVSQVHYDNLPHKRLSSATALSAIVHPDNPHAASMHMHISWTEMRDTTGYWRLMADLNPSIENVATTAAFLACLRGAAGAYFEEGRAQGDRYFMIPALGRTRGTAHFYLEGHRGSDPTGEEDRALALGFGEAVIACYLDLLERERGRAGEASAEACAQQLAYHTLYLFQVLTLDRGTTSGLLVHDQNDAGILGSLPARIDRALLASWATKVPAPQQELVHALVACLSPRCPSPVDEAAKLALANAVRSHYAAHPEALALQARGDRTPATVENHS
ncbi:MAG: coproporphyrinogen III oxidase [Nannocystaceae bacterium]